MQSFRTVAVDDRSSQVCGTDDEGAVPSIHVAVGRGGRAWPSDRDTASLKLRWPFRFGREKLPAPPLDAETTQVPPRPRWQVSVDPARIYAIGDIHGELDKFLVLREAILRDCETARGVKLIVLLGDYVDRGPASAQVLDCLLEPLPEKVLQVCLRGNHEEMLLEVLERRASAGRWLSVGGARTVQSYGIDPNDAGMMGRSVPELTNQFIEGFPARHRTFLERLPVSFATPSYLFVHAGVAPGRTLEEQDDHDLMWTHGSRMENTPLLPGRRVIHGHTPYPQPLVTPERIALDTGAYRGGPLTALRIIGDRIDFVQAP